MNSPLELSGKCTVLVVDDTPGNLSLMSDLLRPDYKVKLAPTGERALQIVEGLLTRGRDTGRVDDVGITGTGTNVVREHPTVRHNRLTRNSVFSGININIFFLSNCVCSINIFSNYIIADFGILFLEFGNLCACFSRESSKFCFGVGRSLHVSIKENTND